MPRNVYIFSIDTRSVNGFVVMYLSEIRIVRIVPYILFSIFLLPTDGIMSRFFYDSVTHERLIEYSELIAEAESCDPGVAQKIIPMPENAAMYPSYHQQFHYYRVLTIINDINAHIIIKQKISGDLSKVCTDFDSFRMYNHERIVQSPIVNTHYPENSNFSAPAGKTISFMPEYEDSNNFNFTDAFSLEDRSMKNEIVKLIQKINSGR